MDLLFFFALKNILFRCLLSSSLSLFFFFPVVLPHRVTIAVTDICFLPPTCYALARVMKFELKKRLFDSNYTLSYQNYKFIIF